MQDPIVEFRKAFSHARQQLHFNNAGVAPWCEPAKRAVLEWTERLSSGGTHAIGAGHEATETTRKEVALTLGANPSEVGFFQSAAGAISQVALGFPFQPGDEILIWDQEYPSMFHPWRIAAERTGAKLKVVSSGEDLRTSVETLKNAVTPKTKMIAFSWVQFRTGAITDLKEITTFAKDRGIFTCSDIIQGAGLLPFDFHASGLDFACGGSHKWFVSPVSAGYLLAREQHLEMLRPILIGAMTYGDPNSTPSLTDRAKVDATRFEPGSRGVIELIGFGASLKFMRELGIARLGQEIEHLSRTLAHRLREKGYRVHSPHEGIHHRGSIVNFSPTPSAKVKSVAEISYVLNANQASHGLRPPGVRLSPHAFNTMEEIERLVSLL